MEEFPAQANRTTESPAALSVATRVGLEEMRKRLGIGEPRRPRIGRDGRFELLRCLGRGGMGEVYLARDTVLEREVALKVVAAKFRHSPHLRLRLLREARSLARLEHPNVLEVYDVDTADSGELVVAVAYVRGSTLERWQIGQPLRTTLAVYLEAGQGLAAAHAAGIIHRDFKPANVLIADASGRVVVGDFGLAAEIRSEVQGGESGATELHDELSTNPGALLGTPAFMAPELLAGQPASIASDQYAFGVSLWEALTCKLPFPALERASVLVRPRGMPRWLFRILRRTLAPQPSERFPDMPSVLAAIERGLARRRIGFTGVAMLGLVAIAVWSWWPAPSEPLTDRCEDTSEPIDEVWTSERRLRLASLEGGQHAVRVLDESAEHWRSRAEENCVAVSNEPLSSEAFAEQRCLMKWRASFDQRIAMFARSPDVNLLEPLRKIEAGCSELEPVLDPEIRRYLDDAEDHRLQRDFDAALVDAETALGLSSTMGAHCKGLDASHERAAAQLELAQIHSEREDIPSAREAIDLALADAATCLQHDLGVRARIVKAKLLAIDLEQPEAAAATLHGVEATLDGLGLPQTSWLREQAAITQGFIALASGEPEQAVEHYRDALRKLGVGPATLLERAKLHIDIGAAFEFAGQFDAALESYETAARIVERELGERHPETRNYRAILALNRVLISGEHTAAAAKELEQLLPTLTDPALRGKARLVLSQYFTDNESDHAIAHAWELARELESLEGITPRSRAEMLTEAGQMLTEVDPWRSAWMLEEAIGIWSALGNHDDNLALSELFYAKVLLVLGREQAARAHASALVEFGTENEDIREVAQVVVDEAARRGSLAAQPR